MKASNNSSKRSQKKLYTKGNGGAVVGVYIAQGCIRLAISRRGLIQKYQTVVLPPNMVLFSPEFETLLSDALRQFCKGYGHISVWATAPFEGLSIRSLQIPKVPKNQILRAVRWSLQMEKPGSLKNLFIDYMVEDGVVTSGTKKIAVTTCAVHNESIERLCTLFDKIGFSLTGLTVPHFTLKGVVCACDDIAKNQDYIFLDIGMTSSRILIFSHGTVILNREFRLGTNAFLDVSMGEIPAGNSAEPFLAQLSAEALDEPSLADSSRASIVESFQPVLGRLMRKFDLALQADSININDLDLRNITLSGPLSDCREVRDFISAYVDIPVVTLNPLDAPSLSLEHAEAAPLARASWFMPAVGLALANNIDTLNLLSPVQSTLERAQHRSLNQSILMVFIIVALGMGAGWWWMGMRIPQLQAEQKTLAQHEMYADASIDTASLTKAVTTAIGQNNGRGEIVRDRLALAMIKELTTLTCGNFQLIEINFRMASVAQRAGVDSDSQENVIHIKGRVYGKCTEQASILAACHIKLDESPLFTQVVINESKSAIHLNTPVLEFDITLTPALSSIIEGGAQ